MNIVLVFSSIFFSCRMNQFKEYVSNQMGQSQRGLISAPKTGRFKLYPDLFVFDPVNDLKLKIMCPVDDQHGFLTTTNSWTNFGKKPPSLIYGLKRNAWLISRLLKCTTCVSYHLSHHQGILSQLPDSEITEVLFFKKSAIFRYMFNIIVGMISKGQTFKKTTETLEEMKKNEVCQIYYGYNCNLSTQIVKELSSEAFKSYGKNMIRDLFMYFFKNIQDTLMQEFRSIKSKELSVDHTYKTW